MPAGLAPSIVPMMNVQKRRKEKQPQQHLFHRCGDSVTHPPQSTLPRRPQNSKRSSLWTTSFPRSTSTQTHPSLYKTAATIMPDVPEDNRHHEVFSIFPVSKCHVPGAVVAALQKKTKSCLKLHNAHIHSCTTIFERFPDTFLDHSTSIRLFFVIGLFVDTSCHGIRNFEGSRQGFAAKPTSSRKSEPSAHSARA